MEVALKMLKKWSKARYLSVVAECVGWIFYWVALKYFVTFMVGLNNGTVIWFDVPV